MHNMSPRERAASQRNTSTAMLGATGYMAIQHTVRKGATNGVSTPRRLDALKDSPRLLALAQHRGQSLEEVSSRQTLTQYSHSSHALASTLCLCTLLTASCT